MRGDGHVDPAAAQMEFLLPPRQHVFAGSGHESDLSVASYRQ
jgi:hypothetical protein